jgi:hypothetical protein
MISDELKPAMQGVFPSIIVSCSLEGVPNTTEISQVYYVDEAHVALSHQFFNKTHRNVRENPFVTVLLFNPENFDNWNMDLQYDRSETEGPLFDMMDMQLEAIATMYGMSNVFKLQAADVYKVLAVRKLNNRIPA